MGQLTKSREALLSARAHLDRLRSEKDHRLLEREWVDFLLDLNRAFNKSSAELKDRSAFQGWPERGRVEGLRRSDPVLSYLVNARGADEHGIAQLAKTEPGGIGINAAVGNTTYIKRMEFRNGQVFIESPQQLRIDVYPAKFTLVPVVNRGRTYAVPTSHQDTPLPNSEPATIGEAACLFYETYFSKAESEILK